MEKTICTKIGTIRRKPIHLADTAESDLSKIKFAVNQLLLSEPDLLVDLGCAAHPLNNQDILIFYNHVSCGEVELGNSDQLNSNQVIVRVSLNTVQKIGKHWFFVLQFILFFKYLALCFLLHFSTHLYTTTFSNTTNNG